MGYASLPESMINTLPETNSLEAIPPKKLILQPYIFRWYVSFREGISIWKNPRS